MDPLELFNDMKVLFSTCFLTHKGRTIKVHAESIIDGLPSYNFTKFKFPYKLGIHYKLADYLEDKGYYAELNKSDELIIKNN